MFHNLHMEELVYIIKYMEINKFLAPRSGLAVKHFIDVGAGVIDEDYRGEGMNKYE